MSSLNTAVFHKLCYVKQLQLISNEASVLPLTDEGEQSDVEHSWPSLFWLPPADNQPGERNMLHLDDELAGLLEAADMPADPAGVHSTKPEAASSVPGEVWAAFSKFAAAVSIDADAIEADAPYAHWHTVA